jgi:HK97 family phage major capsid protein
MAAEETDLLEAIEEHGRATAEKIDELKRDLKAERGFREALERKMNIERVTGGSARNPNVPDPVAQFDRALKCWYPERMARVSPEDYQSYRQAYYKMLRHGHNVLTPEEVKTMQVGIDPDGGWLAPSELSTQIIMVEQANSVVRQVARSLMIGSGSVEIPARLAFPSFGWVGEVTPRNPTATAGLGKIELVAKEAFSEPEITQRLLDDSVIDVEAFMGQEIGSALAQGEEAAFISGDGVAKPHGFTQYPTSNVTDATGTRPFGTLQYIPTGQAGAWPATDDAIYDFLQNVVYSLRPAYRKNAAWIMPTACVQRISQVKDAQKRPLFQPTMAAGQPPTLIGYPLYEAEQMPAVSANSYSIAFANWQRAYWIVDRLGIRMLRDPYTNKPYVRFYTTKRVGGGVVDSCAIKLGKFSAS